MLRHSRQTHTSHAGQQTGLTGGARLLLIGKHAGTQSHTVTTAVITSFVRLDQAGADRMLLKVNKNNRVSALANSKFNLEWVEMTGM